MSPENNNGNGVRVTNKEIYEQLQALKLVVDRIEARTSCLPDHEDRIRKVEAWRYSVPPALLLAAASLAVALSR